MRRYHYNGSQWQTEVVKGTSFMPGIDETLKTLYYNKGQAVAALGIRTDRFDAWVKRGLITPVKISGYGRPYYAKVEIDALEKELEALMIAAANETTSAQAEQEK